MTTLRSSDGLSRPGGAGHGGRFLPLAAALLVPALAFAGGPAFEARQDFAVGVRPYAQVDPAPWGSQPRDPFT
ncbi:MAG: hypothetical protein U0166_07835 [Acidobacteriota bacterium]